MFFYFTITNQDTFESKAKCLSLAENGSDFSAMPKADHSSIRLNQILQKKSRILGRFPGRTQAGEAGRWAIKTINILAENSVMLKLKISAKRFFINRGIHHQGLGVWMVGVI